MDTPVTPAIPPVVLAQASTSPAVVTESSVRSAAAGAETPDIAKVSRVIESKTANGEQSFTLPIQPSEVKSVQVIDLDMLIVLSNGEGVLLREGAFLATTNAAQKVIFGNGTQVPVSALLQRVGVMKPSEAASFRLSSTELKAANSEKQGGQGLNLGKGDDDSQTGPASEEVTQLMQSLQNARLSENAAQEQSQPIKPLKISDNTAQPVIVQPAAAPADIKKNDNTNTGQVKTSVEVSWQADNTYKISNVAIDSGKYPAGQSPTLTSLKLDDNIAASPLKVSLQNPGVSTAANWATDVVQGQIKFTQLSSATKLVLTLEAAQLAQVPEGFSIAGVAVNRNATSAQTFEVTLVAGDDFSHVPISWKVGQADLGQFQVKAQYWAADLQLAEGGRTLTFQYQNVTTRNQLYEGDANGKTILKLPSNGYAYDIQGTSGNDTIVASDGDDILRGMGGNDVLDGGQGRDTVSYEHLGSAGAVVSLAAPPAGTTFTSIENLTGSSGTDRLTGDAQANVLTGLAGDDELSGGAGNDTLSGGDGNDTLIGGSGADGVIGGSGVDFASYATASSGVVVSLVNPALNSGDAAGDAYSAIEGVIGSAYADHLTAAASGSHLLGGAGQDTLLGGAGNDSLDGGDGDDVIMASAGADTVDGGAGVNTYSFANSTSNVEFGVEQWTSLSHIQIVHGSDVVAGGDTLHGHALAERLEGGKGQDTLYGSTGADTLDGGDGTDWVVYAGTTAQLINAVDASASTGDAAGDIFISIEGIEGGSGNDTMVGSSSVFTLRGAVGNDLLIGAENANVLEGGDGDDTLRGGGGADTLRGGAGSDWADFSDQISGQTIRLDDHDSVENALGTAYDDLFISKTGDEANVYQGGADSLSGADGSDTVSYRFASSAVKASLLSGGSLGDARGDLFIGIDNLIGSDFADELQGDRNNNLIQALAGNDTLVYSQGADTLDGGAGIDTMVYTGVTTGVDASLLTKLGSVIGEGSTQEFRSIENLTGGSGSDRLTGDANANTLLGLAGLDELLGGGGDDNLQGGEGDDTLDGGAGADILNGGAGLDTVTYAASAARVTVDLTLTDRGTADARTVGHDQGMGDALIGVESIIGSAGDDLFYASADAVSIHGGSGLDTIDYSKNTQLAATDPGVTVDLSRTSQSPSGSVAGTGWAAGDAFESIENLIGTKGQDSLYGDANANSIQGGDGNDTILGRAGNDTLDGGSGDNTLSYADRTAGVSVDLSATPDNGFITVTTGQETDKIKRFIHLTGGAGSDTLTGDANANLIEGGAGDDTLTGGAGADTLHGGDGNDFVQFVAAVTADLSGHLPSTGEALGDVYNSIEGLVGSAFDDVLGASNSGSTLFGGLGNDTLHSGAGADSLDGGDGTADVVSYAQANQGVTLDLSRTALGSVDNSNEAAGDVLVNVERVVGSAHADIFLAKVGGSVTHFNGGSDATGSADPIKNTVSFESNNSTGIAVSLVGDATYTFVNIDNLTGSTGNDQLTGSSDQNIVLGGLGNDTLVATQGNDTLVGGEGFDFADFGALGHSLGSGVQITLPGALGADQSVVLGGQTIVLRGIEGLSATEFADTVTGSAGDDVVLGFAGNDALSGAGGKDTLNGGDGNDTLDGGDANDSLLGGGGDDSLLGGVGDDTLTGGLGADKLDGGSGTNTASYETAVLIDLVNKANATGEAQGDEYRSIQVLQGSNGADTMVAGAGNDGVRITSYKGGAGNDVFKGIDLSLDSIDGGSGDDTIDLSASAAFTLNLADPRYTSIETVTGGAGSDIITASGLTTAVRLTGGSGNDALTGGAGNDTLEGGIGNDTLMGGDGNDTLDAREDANDRLDSGSGNDEILLAYSGSFGSAAMTVEAGSGTDTLVLYSTPSTLNLNATTFPDAKFENFEALDISRDGADSTVVLSLSGLQALVDSGTNLTLKLGAGDTYQVASGESYVNTSTGVRFSSGGTNYNVVIDYV